MHGRRLPGPTTSGAVFCRQVFAAPARPPCAGIAWAAVTAIGAWTRALPRRYGKRTLALLALILAVGLGLRAYAVVAPVASPADDSRAYFALSKALYEEGSYGGPGFRDASDWSPGAPLLYAVAFYATGGAREGTARIVEALLGVAAILVVFLLGLRLGGRAVGLMAALATAVYPPFIHSTGELMSEPVAIFTLPAAILAFLWAGDRERWSAWLVPGLLFGFTALVRPEYLLVSFAFVILAAVRTVASPRRGWDDAAGSRDWRGGALAAVTLLLALLVPIVPWTVRNAVVLDRVVPISTGGGKALYVGTYLPADGEYQKVKALLVERFQGRDLDPHSEQLDRVDPTPLFDRVAARYPELTRDAALGKIGKQNFSDYFGADPGGYLAMTARKVGRIWGSGVGEAMSSAPGRAIQIVLVLLGLAGLVLLALRRYWLELAVLATPALLVTAVGAVSLAAPRRNEVLMTLVFPLAALALSTCRSAISSGGRWSPSQASSPQS
jgi:4-amino-4-deoxy-L-arabinose transferase-like glycosyltransferase